MNERTINTALNKNQKFSLVYGFFGDKYEYAIKYAVGTYREGYITCGSKSSGSERIKTWKTLTKATEAWSKFLIEHDAINQ